MLTAPTPPPPAPRPPRAPLLRGPPFLQPSLPPLLPTCLPPSNHLLPPHLRSFPLPSLYLLRHRLVRVSLVDGIGKGNSPHLIRRILVSLTASQWQAGAASGGNLHLRSSCWTKEREHETHRSRTAAETWMQASRTPPGKPTIQCRSASHHSQHRSQGILAAARSLSG